MVASGMVENSMRTHRDATVTSSGGTWSASTMNTALAGGSSMVFSRRAAPSASSRWNSCSSITLRLPSMGAIDALRMISDTWSLEMRAPVRSTSRTSGCSPASARRASRASGSSWPVSSSAANARAASCLVLPAGPTKRYACTGAAADRVSCCTARGWPTTPSHTDFAYSANIRCRAVPSPHREWPEPLRRVIASHRW